jgi:hypothetical protein
MNTASTLAAPVFWLLLRKRGSLQPYVATACEGPMVKLVNLKTRIVHYEPQERFWSTFEVAA